MGVFSGWQSAASSVANIIAGLVGQDIVARTIQLTGGTAADVNAAGTIKSTIASGSAGFQLDTAGARLKFSSGGTTDYLMSNGATQISTGGAFLTTGLLTIANDIRPQAGFGGAFDIGTTALAIRTVYTTGIWMATADSSGTPGNATSNTGSGRSAMALGAATVTITNSLVTAASHVFISPRTRDATGLLPTVTTIGAGSFAVTTTANCAADLVFDWFVVS